MLLIIVLAVLLMFICGQIYLKKLRKETEKNAAEISAAENENFEVEQIVNTYNNEAQYQKQRSRLYLQMIFFASVLMILGFGWYLYQEHREAFSVETVKSAVPSWQGVKDNMPHFFIPSPDERKRMYLEYMQKETAELEARKQESVSCCYNCRLEWLMDAKELRELTQAHFWNHKVSTGMMAVFVIWLVFVIIGHVLVKKEHYNWAIFLLFIASVDWLFFFGMIFDPVPATWLEYLVCFLCLGLLIHFFVIHKKQVSKFFKAIDDGLSY